jgi:hypothetical protein
MFAFFLQGENEKTIFDFMQGDLEQTTEKLAELLGDHITIANRHTVIATTKLARQRVNNLINAINEDLLPSSKKNNQKGLFDWIFKKLKK